MQDLILHTSIFVNHFPENKNAKSYVTRLQNSLFLRWQIENPSVFVKLETGKRKWCTDGSINFLFPVSLWQMRLHFRVPVMEMIVLHSICHTHRCELNYLSLRNKLFNEKNAIAKHPTRTFIFQSSLTSFFLYSLFL